jgi:hypothetical protein
MTAPAQTSNFPKKEKNENLQLVPMGMHPAIIYGVVNVGTQDGEWQGKATSSNKLKVLIEFPQHRQLFWKEDTVPTPSALIMDFNYSVSKNKKTGKKSNLLILIESLYGPLQESQYLNFDISQLATMKVFANVLHYVKLDGTTGAKITNLAPFNANMVDPNSIQLTNEVQIYSVQMGYECMSFAKLSYFYRNLIKDSHEGKAHIAKGGRFTKLNEAGEMIIDDGSDNYTAAPMGKIVMLGDFSYDQLKGAGWTDQAMIDNGYARREAAAPVPTPAPQMAPTPVPQAQGVHPINLTPSSNPAHQPQAPMSIAPQMPLASANPTQPMLTMIDKSATYDEFIKIGWTDALLIQHGKAILMPAANDVFPPSGAVAPPPVQAPPVQQVPQAQPMAQAIPTPQPSAAALFQGTPAAPVQQVPQAGIPQAIPPAPISSFEQAPAPMIDDAMPDDLPFG